MGAQASDTSRLRSLRPADVELFYMALARLLRAYQFRDRDRLTLCGISVTQCYALEFLVHEGPSTALDPQRWAAEWGIADPALARGGVAGVKPHTAPPAREVFLLQRSKGKVGARLGKTTGWIHRTTLKMKQVQMVSGVNYERIGDEGLLISHGEERADPTWLAVDQVILCAGQEPQRELVAPLQARGIPTHVIGGAFEAAELDAKRAIDQASRLAARL